MEGSKVEERKEFSLAQDQELRIEVAKGKEAKLIVHEGQAEIFGTELVKNKPYVFGSSAKAAIFTWHGCTVEITGELEVCYVSSETPMVIYLNVHMALEQIRQKLDKEDGLVIGPRVMIVGPENVGKSTLSRILLNYCVRMGRRPIYVDLDCGQGSIAVPGTLGALLVERPADAEEGFLLQTPLVYSYGSPSPSANEKYYNTLVQEMSESVYKHFKRNRKAAVSGCIINTCGWVTGAGFRLLLNIVEAFKVDVILVLDQERVYNDFKNKLGDSVQCVHLPKSGGVFERTQELRRAYRDAKIREYFYGGRTPLYPHVFEVKFEDVKFFKIGAPSVPDSCLPLGMEPEDSSLTCLPVQPSPDLMHILCAVSNAVEEDKVTKSNAAGFVVISNIDMEAKSFTVLSPAPRPLPKPNLVLTNIKYMDM